jgi:broad specificity phosphatase PhoE
MRKITPHSSLSLVKVRSSVKTKETNDTLTAMLSPRSTALPTRLTLISNAPTDAVRSATFPLDEPLLASEKERITSIEWVAPRSQNVCCGPEKRTLQTAVALGLAPTVVTQLMDLDYGNWTGRKFDDLLGSDPNGVAVWLADPNAVPHGGESIAQLIVRIDSWMNEQIGQGHTIAVTHPAVIRASIVAALKVPAQSFWRIDISPLSLTDLRFGGQHWTMRSAGCSL